MTKHEYICAICDVVTSKSDCYKRKVGAVFVNHDYEILATGYNAPPIGFRHCDRAAEEAGTCGDPCLRTIHAEQNAIAQAAKRGTALWGSTLYCTYCPCVDCARLLINIKVARVVIKEMDQRTEGYETLLHSDVVIVTELWKT